MKKIFWILLFPFVFLITACSGMPQGFTNTLVSLPDDGRNLVFILVTAGVTWCLLKLSEVSKVDLKGYAGGIAAALAPVLVTLIEAGLQLIPPVFDNLVVSIIHLIVLAVGSIGTFFLLKRKAPSLR